MDKSGTTCNFCRQGDEEASDLCGKLHVETISDGQIIAAHHKCMQYSAGLIQYKFDHFGGFKIEKVQGELKRGSRINCNICKKDKKRKGKSTRATSGCAVKTCRKSFHYYCAKKNDTCITKRMLVRYKQSDDERVLYRVFCCPDHEKYFKEHKEDLIKCQSSPGSSDTEVDDSLDDDANNDGNASDQTSDQTIDLDQTDVLMTTLYSPPPSKNKKHLQDSNENFSNSNGNLEDEVGDLEHVNQQNSADWQPEIVSVESLTNGLKLEDSSQSLVPVKLFSDATGGDRDYIASTGFDTKSDGGSTASYITDSAATLEKTVISPRKENEMQVMEGKPNGTDRRTEREGRGRTCKRQRESDPSETGKSPTSPEDSCKSSTTDKYPDCVLVITNSLPCTDRAKKEIKQQIGAMSEVVFWSKEEDNLDLSSEHMPYLMNDIVSLLSDNGISDLVQLLTDNSHLTSRLLIHNYALNLHKKLDKNMAEHLLESLMTSIDDTVKKINNKQVCQLLSTKDGTKAIAIFVGHNIDANNKLRSTLGIEEMSKSCLHKLTGKIPLLNVGSVQQQEKESTKLMGWINNTFEDQPEVVFYPKETFLLDGGVSSVSQLVAGQLLRAKDDEWGLSTDEGETSYRTDIVCIYRMDTKIVNYTNFCHKCIVNYLPFTRPMVFVIDIVDRAFEDVDDLVPEVVRDSCTVDIYTASPPTRDTPVSSVLLHIYTDGSPQRKTGRKPNDMKSPAFSSSKKVTGGGVRSETLNKRCRHTSSDDNSSSPATMSNGLSRTDQPSPSKGSSKRKRTK